MAAGFRIIDGTGSKRAAEVTTGNALLVQTVSSTTSIPLTVQYDATVNNAAAPLAAAGTWFKGIYYTVSGGYRFNVGIISAFAGDIKSALRMSKLLTVGTYNLGTATFSGNGFNFNSPQFATFIECEVTTATNNGTNLVLNITYVDQVGSPGTATVTILKSAPVGTKFVATLATGDFGVLSVTNVSVSSGGPLTGVININAGLLFDTEYIGTALATQRVTPSAGTVVLNAGDVMALDYGTPGGTGNVERAMIVTGVLEPVT